MNRNALTTAVLVTGLALPMIGGLARAASVSTSPKPARHVTRPLSTITVKVVSTADYQRRAKGADATVTADGKLAQWIITSSDSDSCVAWLPETARPNVATVQLDALVACQRVIARTR